MRWILDALHYARDRQVRGGIPLVEVFAFSQADAPEEHNSDLDEVTTCNGHGKGDVIALFLLLLIFIKHIIRGAY